MALGDANDPFSFHGYNYVANNPVNLKDHNGKSYEDCITWCNAEFETCFLEVGDVYSDCLTWAYILYLLCKVDRWNQVYNKVDCDAIYEDRQSNCEERREIRLMLCEEHYENCLQDCSDKWSCSLSWTAP